MPYESFERRVVYFNFIFASSIKDSLQKKSLVGAFEINENVLRTELRWGDI